MVQKLKFKPYRYSSNALIVCLIVCLFFGLPNLIFSRPFLSRSKDSARQLPLLERIILQKDQTSLKVQILFNRYSRHRKFELENPNRIVVDFFNSENIQASRYTEVNDFGIKAIRAGQFKSNISRVVFDAKDKIPFYEIKEIEGGVQLSFWLDEEAYKIGEQVKEIPVEKIKKEELEISEEMDLVALFNQARTVSFQGNREESIEICKKILDEDPDYHDVRIFLGHIYARNQEYDSARKELQEVIEAQPDSIYALNELVNIELWSNNLLQALSYSDKGLKIDPNNEYFLYRKALILEKLEDFEEAFKTIDILLGINPSHEEAIKLSERIQYSIPTPKPRVEAKAPGVDFMVEIKGNYFIPSEQAFKDIYGEGLMYGGEASIGFIKYLSLWFGGAYFSKKGKLTCTEEEIQLKTYYLGGGLKLRLPIGITNFYLGGGLNYHQYKEFTPIGDVKKDGLGYIGKVGWFVEIPGGLIIDLYGNYTYCKIKPEELEIDIGGLEAGVGLGFKF